MSKPKWTADDVEIAVTKFLDPRKNLIIPNVSWGFFKWHEADILVIRPSMWAAEIEIKVSRQDIKKDLDKKHHHKDKRIRELWFAVPEELSDDENIPACAGIISVSEHRGRRFCKRKRLPVADKSARKITAAEQETLLRLSYFRVISLKEKLQGYRARLRDCREEISSLRKRAAPGS